MRRFCLQKRTKSAVYRCVVCVRVASAEGAVGTNSHGQDAVVRGVHSEQAQGGTAAAGTAVRRPAAASRHAERRRSIPASAPPSAQLPRTNHGPHPIRNNNNNNNNNCTALQLSSHYEREREREFIFHIATTLEQAHSRNTKLGGLPERHLAHQSWPPIATIYCKHTVTKLYRQ